MVIVATQITSLQQLSDFKRRAWVCNDPSWLIQCGPESVSTLTWKFDVNKLQVRNDLAKGQVKVVTGCLKGDCKSCTKEVADLCKLNAALSLKPCIC